MAVGSAATEALLTAKGGEISTYCLGQYLQLMAEADLSAEATEDGNTCGTAIALVSPPRLSSITLAPVGGLVGESWMYYRLPKPASFGACAANSGIGGGLTLWTYQCLSVFRDTSNT